MKISRRAIRRIIREALTPQGAQQKYGSVLFGDARGLGEPDTPPEDELEAALGRWGGSGAGSESLRTSLLPDHVSDLRDMAGMGEWNDVLAIPEWADKAFRFISVTRKAAAEMSASAPAEPVFGEMGQVGTKQVVVAPSFPLLPGMPAASWSLDLGTGYLDWVIEQVGSGPKPCAVIAVARTGGPNFGALVLNPEVLGGAGIGTFSQEQEVLQVASLSNVELQIFIPLPGSEEDMVDFLLDYVKEM